MQDTVAGLILLGIGLTLIFWGYRIAKLAIPVWGFIVGFPIGATLASLWFDGAGSGLLGGLLGGVLFAWLSTVFYRLSVILSGALIGYGIGVNLAAVLGYSSDSSLRIGGLIVGILLAVIFIIINAPKYYLIILTSVIGAAAGTVGLLVAIGKISANALGDLSSHTGLLPMFWGVIFVAAAVGGMLYQSSALRRTKNT